MSTVARAGISGGLSAKLKQDDAKASQPSTQKKKQAEGASSSSSVAQPSEKKPAAAGAAAAEAGAAARPTASKETVSAHRRAHAQNHTATMLQGEVSGRLTAPPVAGASAEAGASLASSTTSALSSPGVKAAMTEGGDGPSDGGSIFEKRRAEQEARANQEKIQAESTTTTSDRPEAPTEGTLERTQRIAGEAFDPSKLKDGESVELTVGGSGSVVVKGEATDKIAVKKNADGTYDVTVEGNTAVGIAGGPEGKAGPLSIGGSGEVGGKSTTKVEIKAQNAEEAQKIVDALAKKAAMDRARQVVPGGQLLPDPVSQETNDLIKKRTVAVEHTWGFEMGGTAGVGQADSQSPVNVGVRGSTKGSDTTTTRTEYKLGPDGEPYPAKVIETRTKSGEDYVGAGITGQAGDATVSSDAKFGRKRTSTHELIVTKELPPPGSSDPVKETAVVRETQTREDVSGLSGDKTTVKKEVEVDLSKIDRTSLNKVFNTPNPTEYAKKMSELPVTRAEVETSRSSTKTSGGPGPYNSKTTEEKIVFQVDPAKRGQVFAQTDEDPARLKTLADPSREVVFQSKESTTEGVGTGGKIGVSVSRVGVEVEADAKKVATREGEPQTLARDEGLARV